MQVVNHILLLFFFITPLLPTRFLFQESEFLRVVFLYLVLCIIMLNSVFALFKRKRFSVTITSHTGILAVFVVVIGFSSYISIRPVVALFGSYPHGTQSFLFFISLAALFFFLLTYKDPKEYRNIIIAMIAGLLVNALYGISTYITQSVHNNQPPPRISSLETHAIPFGILMMIGFFASMSLLKRIHQKFQSLIFGAILLFVLGIIISFSRWVWFSTLLVLFVFWIRWLRDRPFIYIMRSNHRLFITALIVIGLFSFLFIKPVVKRLEPLTHWTPTTSQYIRLLELQDAVGLAFDKAVPFGVGPSNLEFYFPRYRSTAINQTQEWYMYPQQIRNHYLDLYIAYGPFALISYSALIFLIASRFLGTLRRDTRSFQWSYLCLFSAWIALVIHGITYYYTATTWIYFITLSAILLKKIPAHTVLTAQLPKLFSFAVSAALFIGVVIIGIVVTGLIITEWWFVQGVQLYSQNSYVKQGFGDANILFVQYRFTREDSFLLDKSLQHLKTALIINPYQNVVYSRQYAHTLALRSRMESHNEKAIILLNEAYDSLSKVIATNPYDFLSLDMRASVSYLIAERDYNRQKYLLRTLADLQKVTTLDIINPIRYDNLGLVRRDAGILEDAELAFRKAIRLKADFINAYIHLGETLEMQGKAKEARKIYERALRINPQSDLLKKKIEAIEL